MTSDHRVEYSKAILFEFIQRKGQSHSMSSAEFDLARRWCDRGLPLRVVLQGIRETGGKPRTLLACERSVEEQVTRWHQAVGSLKTLPPAMPLDAAWDAQWGKAERERLAEKYGRTK